MSTKEYRKGYEHGVMGKAEQRGNYVKGTKDYLNYILSFEAGRYAKSKREFKVREAERMHVPLKVTQAGKPSIRKERS